MALQILVHSRRPNSRGRGYDMQGLVGKSCQHVG